MDEQPTILSDESSYLTIQPGQFALLTTFEVVYMPNDLIAFISMKFGKSRGGLINISGFHVDPEFNGMLIFSVYNAGPRPITLTYKEDVFMIIFSQISKKLDSSPKKDHQNQFNLESKHWESLLGEQISPRMLSDRLTKLETLQTEFNSLRTTVDDLKLFKKLVIIVGGISGIILAAVLGWLLPNTTNLLGGTT